MSKPWPKVRLGDVLKPTAHPVDVNPDELYREIGIRSHGKGIFHKTPISGLELGNKRVFWVQPGDFVLNIVFAWEGAVAVLSEAEAGMIGSHRFPTFRADESRLDSRFLLAFFKTREGLALLGRVSPGGAGRNRTLSKTAFMNQLIPIPPIAEQHRILGRIEAVSAEIDEVRNLREEQDVELRQLMLSSFNRIAESAPTRVMRDVAPLVRRAISVDAIESYPELGIRSFGKGTFHKPPLNGMELGDKRVFRIEKDDLLFSNVFAWEGAIAVAKGDDDGRVGSHRYITCVPKDGAATARFLCFYFLADDGLGKIRAASPGGAGRNRTLGLEALAGIEVPFPPLNEQHWFAQLLLQLDELKRLQSEATTELDAMLPSLLDRAFQQQL